MMVLSVALFDKSPYQNLIVKGMMLDKDGKKMSKSKGNYPPMDQVLETYGADIFRLFLLSSPVVECEAVRYYEDVLKDMKKEFFLIYWNTVKFFTTYANEHNFTPNINFESENILDQWILARLKEVKLTVYKNMDNYLIMPSARELIPFINDLSTWYVRRSRDRIKDGDLNALNTLYFVLREFTILISPFIPFISEKVYQILKQDNQKGYDSVHLEIMDFDSIHLSETETQILEKMKQDRKIISEALNLRTKSQISLRQPLGYVYSKNIINFEEIFKEELNIKEISYEVREFKSKVESEDGSLILDIEITQELADEKIIREFTRSIQDMRKNLGLQVSDKIKVFYSKEDLNEELIQRFKEQLIRKLNAVSFEEDSENKIELVG